MSKARTESCCSSMVANRRKQREHGRISRQAATAELQPTAKLLPAKLPGCLVREIRQGKKTSSSVRRMRIYLDVL